MLKVLYFVPPSPHFAGVERVVHTVAGGLAEDVNGIEVHVVYATHYEKEIIGQPAYAVRFLGVERLSSCFVPLRREVRRIRPDILVVAQIEPAVVAWAATRGLGVKAFVTHLHGNPRIEEERGGVRTRFAFSAFRRVVSKRSAATLAVSPTLCEYVAATLCRGLPVMFAPNPGRSLSHDQEQRVGDDSPDSTYRLVALARLSYQKGIDVLLHAVALARSGGARIHLDLVGSGPDEQQAHALARELAVEDIVNFAGFDPDPSRWLRAADCYVLSSRWEGFPLVLLEALQAGLPIVATDCEFGPADLITDPSIGELVTEGDATALAAGITRASTRVSRFEDIDRRKELAAGYSPDAVVREHQKLLETVWRSVERESRTS